MKIVTIIDSIPPLCGGAQNVAWVLSKTFALKGHESHIITLGKETSNFQKEGITIHSIKEPKKTHLYFYKHSRLLFSTRSKMYIFR